MLGDFQRSETLIRIVDDIFGPLKRENIALGVHEGVWQDRDCGWGFSNLCMWKGFIFPDSFNMYDCVMKFNNWISVWIYKYNYLKY